jgi:hypothetical protein
VRASLVSILGATRLTHIVGSTDLLPRGVIGGVPENAHEALEFQLRTLNKLRKQMALKAQVEACVLPNYYVYQQRLESC